MGGKQCLNLNMKSKVLDQSFKTVMSGRIYMMFNAYSQKIQVVTFLLWNQ